MKKNVFSLWLKELCALVFVQSVQAFLLAIIMVVIVSTTVTSTNSTGQEREDALAASGLIGIIALASISKIENLVKKIFGLDSSITDTSMRGGMGALAGSLIAFRMASRVANNVPKVAGGVKDIYDSKKQKLTAMKRYNRDLNALGVGNNPNTSQLAGAGAVLPTGVNGQNGAVNNAVGGSGSGNASGNGNLNLGNAVVNISNGTVNSNGLKDGKLDMEKYNKIKDRFDDNMDAAKKTRSQGYKKIASGILETGGALTGATVGAAVGLATDQNAVTTAMAGLGVGDLVGEMSTNFAISTKNTIRDISITVNVIAVIILLFIFFLLLIFIFFLLFFLYFFVFIY